MIGFSVRVFAACEARLGLALAEPQHPLTPYRGMKKIRDTGKLGLGRIVAITGIGGLGSYGVQ
ncbi:hypothetical protein ACWGQ5_28655 [Streptomyces sp. NPDC055722]